MLHTHSVHIVYDDAGGANESTTSNNLLEPTKMCAKYNQ